MFRQHEKNWTIAMRDEKNTLQANILAMRLGNTNVKFPDFITIIDKLRLFQ